MHGAALFQESAEFERLLERPEYIQWKKLSFIKSVYQKKTTEETPDGIFNPKYVSADGHFEVVLTRSGVILDENTDYVNMGTYNYYSPHNQAALHVQYDVDPYNRWGNTPEELMIKREKTHNALEDWKPTL